MPCLVPLAGMHACMHPSHLGIFAIVEVIMVRKTLPLGPALSLTGRECKILPYGSVLHTNEIGSVMRGTFGSFIPQITPFVGSRAEKKVGEQRCSLAGGPHFVPPA